MTTATITNRRGVEQKRKTRGAFARNGMRETPSRVLDSSTDDATDRLAADPVFIPAVVRAMQMMEEMLAEKRAQKRAHK
jgi:hypothetical protein